MAHNKFAVIWLDFIPLSLPVATAQEAIDKAKAMAAKGVSRGLRAVAFSLEGSPDLVTLWEPEKAVQA
jgi:hypothetical protein